MKLPLLRLALVATALAVATPVFGWDKAATPQKRLEILAGAAKRSDQGELAACFAPPFDGPVMQTFVENTIEYEKNVTRFFQLVAEKLGQEGLDAIGKQEEAVSELHYICGTTITVGAVKVEPDKAVAHVAFVDNKDENFKGEKDLLLVKVGEDDWRVVFDQEPWPGGDTDKNFTELSSALSKLAIELDNVCKAAQEDKLTKDQAEAAIKVAKGNVTRYYTIMRASREESAQAVKDKAAAAAAAQAKKEAAAKKAADDEAAKKEADKKEAARREALKNAPPPPPPPPVAAKKKEGAEGEGGDETPEAQKGPDNTGMYIVFGLLGVACLVVVGILLSKLKGEKKAGRGGGGGGGGGGRGRSARTKKRR